MQMNLKILKCHALSQKIICLSALHTSLSRTFVRLLYTYEYRYIWHRNHTYSVASAPAVTSAGLVCRESDYWDSVQFTQITNKNKGN